MIDIRLLRQYTDQWYSHQKYGIHPYGVHIDDGCNILNQFGMTEWGARDLHAAYCLHDVMEDNKDIRPLDILEVYLRHGWTQETDVRNIPSIRWAMRVTDEEGETRAERKAATYPKIREECEAIIVKLTDRIANVRRGGKIEMYRKEHPCFREALYVPGRRTQPMWDWLDGALNFSHRVNRLPARRSLRENDPRL